MALFRSLLMQAARRIVADPRARAKAAEFVEEEVKPRLAAARDELKDISEQSDPVRNPRDFAYRLGVRIGRIKRGDP